ncbi:hypothetical protein PPO43_14105 [Saprospira sp. CCB-QB6]|uniref:hypothetical protein n=1 Tax=Saprospira sp. CCB-QB6 TaxID=3023936 RepID=UPI0023491824|nr:hypothetical protein [Saprospira sp. CCB-QB6]WCL81104.1 hypothetical protein PPO43_14105 [Saprospira sp. CCB-QB6]
MKRFAIYFLGLFLSLGLLSSCEEAEKLTQFNLDYNSTVTIPSTFGVQVPFDVSTPAISTSASSQFESNDTRKDLIEEIQLTEMTLTINSPSGADFSFLESIEVFISADSLGETRIAYQDSVAVAAGESLSLTTTGVDLQEYIKADEFSLRVNAVTDEAISQDHELNIYTKFFVDAKIFGI